MSRPYDIVVLGATGTVGKLVCEHLAQHYQGKVKWAMAARNKGKMEKVRQDLAGTYRLVQDVPLLVADVSDQPAISRVASQTKVVLALNGPYALMGTPVIEACLQEGTHYCDITGEVQWARRMVQQHHDEAAKKKVKIVHFCGFDSIPSDLGTAFMVNHIQETYGRPCKSVVTQFVKGSGGVGGGTIASLLGVFDSPKEELKAIGDPYCLNPPDSKRGPDQPDSLGFHYSDATSRYLGPFVMAPINTRAVRRSNALLGYRYGKDFSYSEYLQLPNLPAAILLSFFMTLGSLLAYVNVTRWLLRKLSPAQGTGPSRETMDKGSFQMDLVGTTQEEIGPSHTVLGSVIGHTKADPGYLATSRFVLEAGICLATQEDELRQAGMLQGGVLTPGSAMGLVLVRRLQAAGITFEIKGEIGSDKKHH